MGKRRFSSLYLQGTMGKAWLAPLATLYGMGVAVRNKFFDWGWLRSAKYDIPVVCVGNITVGGTGKTPVTEYLVRHLGRDFNVAVLSLGYKRRTKGYLEVQAGTPFLDSGDEPKQMKLKFPDIVVAVCEKRAAGIERIREDHPEINLVLLDDAFQHRYVEPWVNIVLMDYNRPIWRDHMLPRGMLRDHPSQISRANHVIVTKCPPSMTALDRRIVRKALGLYPYQGLYFSFTEAAAPRPIFPGDDPLPLKKGGTVVAMSGIASPAGFHDTLSADYRIVEKLIYPDHYPYRRRDLATMIKLLDASPAGTVIVTTEKDSVKLRNANKIPEQLRRALYYIPIEVVLDRSSEKEFIEKLDYDVRTNPRDRLLRS